MLDRLSEKTGLDGNIIKGIASFAILVIMIALIILFRGRTPKRNVVLREVKPEEIVLLLDRVKDNYTLDIEEEVNGNKKELYYYTDSKVKLYDGSLIGEDGVLVYKNKPYIVYRKEIDNVKDMKLYKYTGNTSFIDNPFYNIELLKNVINYCEMTSLNVVKVNCRVNLTDYLTEYNKMYNKNIEIDYDTKISMDIVHYSDGIGKIIVDYSSINRVLNNNDSSVKYGIKIESINENDFSDIIEYFNKTLNK